MRNQKHIRRANRSAFTLIELLLVMVILAILAGVVVNKFGGIRERAQKTREDTDIAAIKHAVEQFDLVNGRFPTNEEGLNALVTKPSEDLPDWKPCLDKLPMDPWNHPYIYRIPGANGQDFDVTCAGPEGH
jgi:general secretion pathway protein G